MARARERERVMGRTQSCTEGSTRASHVPLVHVNTGRGTAQVGGGGGESFVGTKTIAEYQHCVY